MKRFVLFNSSLLFLAGLSAFRFAPPGPFVVPAAVKEALTKNIPPPKE